MSHFNATSSQKFTLFAPTSVAEKTYGESTVKSVFANFYEMAADIQNVFDAMRKVTVFQHGSLT